MNEPRVVGGGLRIILGGGIGAGKSVAGRRFAMLGFSVVDADRLGHEILEPGGPAFYAVAERWPGAVIGGRIDRAILAACVFADVDELAELESLTHPHIIRRIEEIGAEADHLVVEVPVLLEPEGDWVTVYLAAPDAVRRHRAILRGGAPDDVDRRMDRQARDEAWLEWADEIIVNDGTIEHLDRAIDALVHHLEATPGGATFS